MQNMKGDSILHKDDLLNKIPSGIIIFNERNEILSINNSGREFIKQTSEYITEVIKDMVKLTLAKRESVQKIIRCCDHYEFFIWNIKTEYIQLPSVQIAVIIQDKTINTKLKQSVLKAEKLAVIGYVAMGSLMEIRNPLTSALGFCRLIQEGEKVEKDYLEIVSKDLEQIQDIIESYAAISEPSVKKCIENIYHKLWTFIHNKVLSYRLVTVTNSGDDSLIGDISEEQIDSMLKFIKSLNIWAEESIYIMNIEIKKESRCLKCDLAVINGFSNNIYRSNVLKTVNHYKVDNNQINIQIINNEEIDIGLNFDAI